MLTTSVDVMKVKDPPLPPFYIFHSLLLYLFARLEPHVIRVDTKAFILIYSDWALLE